jgi:amino acid transporter
MEGPSLQASSEDSFNMTVNGGVAEEFESNGERTKLLPPPHPLSNGTYPPDQLSLQVDSTEGDRSSKQGTIFGVYIPVVLGIMGVVVFLRLTWMVGQGGLLMALFILGLSASVSWLTILSVCAIATNGTVKGGGVYYMISRTLGPQFGGSLGVVAYIAQVGLAAINLIGFGDAVVETFDAYGFPLTLILPIPKDWIAFIVATITLFFCVIVCVVGASFYVKCSLLIYISIIISLLCWLVSFLFRETLFPHSVAGYTGPSSRTFVENLLPNPNADYGLVALFAIFFPAVTGITTGANLSGDLKEPSRSIPAGTIHAFVQAVLVYIVLFSVTAATVSRDALAVHYDMAQRIGLSYALMTLGLFACVISGSLNGIITGSRLLQAIARDNLIPILKPFGQGSGKNDEGRVAVLGSAVIVQILIFGKLNAIAPLVTIFCLLTYAGVNLSYFALTISGAPNFRPSFRHSSWQTSLLGFVVAMAVMFVVNLLQAVIAILLCVVIMLYIQMLGPVTAWGDISQAIMFHQIRKYLLRLDVRRRHVKYWRPSLLYFVDSPLSPSSFALIETCNYIKKGGLFILGHVALEEETALQEIVRFEEVASDLVGLMEVKAFVKVTRAATMAGGMESLLLSSGLGDMRPNLVVLGWPRAYSTPDEVVPTPSVTALPDILLPFQGMSKGNSSLSVEQLQAILATIVAMGKGFLLARHFGHLSPGEFRSRDVPFFKKKVVDPVMKTALRRKKQFVDLWLYTDPNASSPQRGNVSLALLLGHIASRGKNWEKRTKLRLCGWACDEEKAQVMRKHLQDILKCTRIRGTTEVFLITPDSSFVMRSFCKMRIPEAFEEVRADVTKEPLTIHQKVALYNDHAARVQEIARNIHLRDLSALQRVAVLNEVIARSSTSSVMTFVTVPSPPAENLEAFYTYMELLDTLTRNLKPTMLVYTQETVLTQEL